MRGNTVVFPFQLLKRRNGTQFYTESKASQQFFFRVVSLRINVCLSVFMLSYTGGPSAAILCHTAMYVICSVMMRWHHRCAKYVVARLLTCVACALPQHMAIEHITFSRWVH